MSYQVIARKYRPQRFSEVVGQDHITQTLSQAIQKNRIAHAYLFCGPRGTGKTTVARIFAKCLNCTDGPRVDFDDQDPRCREIAEGRSLDVIEIDGASNRGIEEIRELRDTVKYAPASSRFKIYIIDEVHMLTKEAFNALLKTLEEPPAHVKFMFATTEPEKILPTILSRCQRFDLRRIPAALIASHLAEIAGLEKVAVDPAALHAIARGADGGMRDAESALDQLISFCGERIEEADVLAMFGLTSETQILDLSEALLAGDAAKTLQGLDELARNGKDLGRFLADLLGHFRNLLVFQVSGGNTTLLEMSQAEEASLASQSARIGGPALTRILDILSDCETRLRDAASKRILIEVALLKAMDSRSTVSIDSLIQRLGELPSKGPDAPIPPVPARQGAASSQPPSGPRADAPKSRSVESPAVPSPVPGAAVSDLESLWAGVTDAVGRVSPFIRGYLLEAHPVSFDGRILTIGFAPEFADHIDLVDNARNRSVIQEQLKQMGHDAGQIRFIKAEAPVRKAPPVPEPVSVPAAGRPEPVPTAAAVPVATKPASGPRGAVDFKNDPLIQKALEIFKGQIVEVRN